MLTLLAGLLIFHGLHMVPTIPVARARWVERLGVNGYKGLFTVISLVSLALIVMGYGEMRGLARGNPQLWVPPAATKHVAYLLMWPAFILMVASNVLSRIRDRVGHPFLAAVKLWALAHLLVRGDLASVLLFGSFLAYAVCDRISVKRRDARGPLGHRAGTATGDVIAVVGGTALYAAFVYAVHGWLIGVPLLKG